jgi:hypothetical protein
MILSTGRSYVFVHIPKTGGTSMALALEARAMRDDIMLGDTPKARQRRRKVQGMETRGRLWKHSTLSDIEGLVPDDVLDGLFAFTLVRNPWDRAVSYYHWLRSQSFDHPSVRLAKAAAFADFVRDPRTMAAFRQAPASHYMRRSDGTQQCDAYIRIEHLATDVAPLVAHLGFDLTLPHANRSDRDRDYRTYFTDESAQAVADSCAEDIAQFGYGFDPSP